MSTLLRRRDGWIVTCHRRFEPHALEEVRLVLPGATVRRLDEGVWWVQAATDREVDTLDRCFVAHRPTFVEHLAPITSALDLSGEWSDLDLVATSVSSAISIGSLA